MTAATWTYTLRVSRATIIQTSPFSNEATPAHSSSFSDTLTTTGNFGGVGFTTTTPPLGSSAGIKVSTAGTVTTTGTLPAGTYAVAGVDNDNYGDTGTWSYSLTVSSKAITQIAPTTDAVTTGKAFTTTLRVSGAHGTASFTQTSGEPQLTVASSGKISAPSGLRAGTYKATGTVKDPSGDSGAWSFS